MSLPQTASVVAIATGYSPSQPSGRAAPASPLARHVAFMRQEWRDRFANYEHAENVDITGLSDAEQDAICDLAAASLDAIVKTRAPDLATFADKMRLVDKTGTYQADGYFEELLADVDALAKRAIILPTRSDLARVAGSLIKRGLAKATPWYEWSRANVFRLDAQCRDFADESSGDVWRLQIQWLGLHFGAEIGRTPRKPTDGEVSIQRARLAAKEEA